MLLVFGMQETRENVKLLLQLADDFVAKGNLHASSILGWCAAVDKRYKDFSSRMEKYRLQLEAKLGVSVPEVGEKIVVHPSDDFLT